MLYALYGVYYGLAYGTAKALVADLVPAELRGTAYGTYNAVLGHPGLSGVGHRRRAVAGRRGVERLRPVGAVYLWRRYGPAGGGVVVDVASGGLRCLTGSAGAHSHRSCGVRQLAAAVVGGAGYGKPAWRRAVSLYHSIMVWGVAQVFFFRGSISGSGCDDATGLRGLGG